MSIKINNQKINNQKLTLDGMGKGHMIFVYKVSRLVTWQLVMWPKKLQTDWTISEKDRI